jgi:hypothetical protein
MISRRMKIVVDIKEDVYSLKERLSRACTNNMELRGTLKDIVRKCETILMDKNVSNEVKEYMKGMYGKPPAPVDEEISKRIIGDDEVITCRPADLLEPEFDKFKTEGQEKGFVKSDEDALTYALYPPVAPKFLKGEAEEEELKPPHAFSEDEAIGIPTQYNVEVSYLRIPTMYDAYTATASNLVPKSATIDIDLSSPVYTDEEKELTLYTDYIFADNEQSDVNLSIDIKDENNATIKRHELSDIKTKRNMLTTLKGKFLTSGN